jgi:hypothetical protein
MEQMKKKGGYTLLALGFLIPMIFFAFSEKYEGEGSWMARLYEGEIVLQEGIRVKELKREGMAAVPKVQREEAKKNAERMVDPQISRGEKADILASVDPEFKTLPPGEREKVLEVLTPGELAGIYIAAAGYRVDHVLGSTPYINKSSIPYRYVLAGGIILIFLGAVLFFF